MNHPKTFKYLDEVASAVTLLGGGEAITNWGESTQKPYWDILASFGISRGEGEDNLTENYIFWSLNSKLTNSDLSISNLASYTNKLKDIGYL